MPLKEEYNSSTFKIPSVSIEQTISESFDPFSGLDIDTNTFKNNGPYSRQDIDDSNQDGRIPLGCFVFKDNNEYSDDFVDIFRDEEFVPISKKNLIPNGNGLGVQSKFSRKPYYNYGFQETPYLPSGGWGYCTFDAVLEQNKVREESLYLESNLNQNTRFEDYGIGRSHLLSFEQTNFTGFTDDPNRKPDYNYTTGSSGWFPYCFDFTGTLARPQAHLDLIRRGFKSFYDGIYTFPPGHLGGFTEYEGPDSYSATEIINDCDEFFFRVTYDGCLNPYMRTNTDGTIDIASDNSNIHSDMAEIDTNKDGTRNWPNAPSRVMLPNIAKWIITDEAYSHGKCLEFLATNTKNNIRLATNGTLSNSNGNFDWNNPDAGFYDEYKSDITHNQCRALNQVIRIDEGNLVRYSDVTIKFKMWTDERFYDSNVPLPEVELALLDSDGSLSSPFRVQDREYGTSNYGYYKQHGYWPQGEFNSQRYNDDLGVSKRYSGFGSMGRFKNTETNKWEEFEYTFNLGKHYHYGSTLNPRRVYFMVQAAGKFLGRVLLDDFELIESHDFIPDCDVRKKLSVGEYGKADLTKYYDKDLQPEEYKDSQAPLEAQFYFYPTYNTDKTFDVKRTPMYRDFQSGMFYIYDINWGDGSPNEFTSEPEPIDEEKALYHLYTKNGIFEITGTMIRTKHNKYGTEQVGLAKVKNFTLRIHINEGVAEDFTYFGSDGFSFIPLKNSTPIIGGYSKQSAYYKNIKRLLGVIDDETKIFVPFNYEGDRLKTQIAFDKMDSSFSSDFPLLKAYKEERTKDGNVIYNGLKPNTSELGEGLGDSDVTCIKYYNEPKSIWEMFGFNENDLNIGIPNHRRYWKNIIPKGYSIFNRQGISTDGNIDIYSEQDWIDVDNDGVPDFYYPVLPKYGADGRFLQTTDDDGNPIIGVYPITTTDAGDFSITEEKKPYPLDAPITNEFETDVNLKINIVNDPIENNVFNDNSGNYNYGFIIMDYKPKFNNETLSPQKTKRMTILKTSTTNGAF